jgi:cell fate regulator YaaT (PSP1 superfamily)
MNERIKRFQARAKSGNEITGSDKLIMDTDKFERREQIYKKIVLEYFPNTKTIDTTDIDLEQTINVIINDNNFLKDM